MDVDTLWLLRVLDIWGRVHRKEFCKTSISKILFKWTKGDVTVFNCSARWVLLNNYDVHLKLLLILYVSSILIKIFKNKWIHLNWGLSEERKIICNISVILYKIIGISLAEFQNELGKVLLFSRLKLYRNINYHSCESLSQNNLYVSSW